MNTEWKPIASAPKDGAAIWAIGQIYGKPFQYECHWNGIEWYHGFGDGWASLEPSHWMPLPPAPTSHPIPTGATGERDWELSCDECNGSGHVFVKHQVAERKTDVQEFKEECEGCDGRGFNIAFEDIPGIAEYVKTCRPAPSAPGDGQKVYHFEQRSRFGPWIEVEKPTAKSVEFVKRSDAPAAGDALDMVRLRRIAWLIGSIFVHGDFKAETFNERELEKLLRENGTFWESLEQFDAALAAIAQQSQRKEA
jgi:hypothetical protein